MGCLVEDLKNVSANQRPEWPSWISNLSEEIQHFYWTPRETFV